MTININDVELELDIMDIETTEKYQKAYAAVGDRVKELGASDLPLWEQLKQQCVAIRECFDGIFGVGTADRILSGYNYRDHFQAYETLTDECERQKKEMIDMANKVKNKYKNRSQRRAKK